ncbi:hypothetical protein ABTY98_23875 [Streptomyces sp. NPDC096040]|uniref:hypothetical protein n=1 Tax=Streptomyces sp. NPDC096040 TaxID=3155541 RepID=UPI00331B5DD6
MTSSAVLPGVAVRVSHTVAGRRALQLALLVGGLLALGLLCGGRAQAAEGTQTVPPPLLTSVVSRLDVDKVVPHSEPVRDEKATPRETARHPCVTHSASTTPVAPVAHAAPALPAVPVAPVVPVVGETVRSVTAAVTQGLGDVAQQVSELPAKLTTRPLPVQLPTLPALPGTSSTLPVSEPPAESPPVPVTSAPGTTEARPAVTDGVRQRTAQQTARTKKPATTVTSYGPQGTTVTPAPVSGTAAHTHTGGHRAPHAVDAPGHPAPTGEPDGVLGKQAVDGGSSRHGDAYAVTFDDRGPLRLVPGAAARVDAAGTRDRYRDIPVFPG